MPRAEQFVFVHGAFLGGWSFDMVRRLLDRPSTAVDLPGRDTPPEDLPSIGLGDWVDAVVGAAEDTGAEHLCVVGHSLGALTALLAADRLGDRVNALVMLSGCVPPEGGSIADEIMERQDQFGSDGLFSPMEPDLARQAFCDDMTDADAEMHIRRCVPEPAGVLTEAVRRDSPPSIPTIYFRPTADRAVPLELQGRFIENLPTRPLEVFIDDAHHNFFWSQPAILADSLNRL